MEENEIEQEEFDGTDYKTLYEQEQERARLESEKREKAEWRFKKTAKELNDLKANKSNLSDMDEVQSIVDKRLSEEMYYLNNPLAKEFKQDIEALKKTNSLSTEDAYTLFLAKNHPDRLGKSSTTWVEWVPAVEWPTKAYSEMTLEELQALRAKG